MRMRIPSEEQLLELGVLKLSRLLKRPKLGGLKLNVVLRPLKPGLSLQSSVLKPFQLKPLKLKKLVKTPTEKLLSGLLLLLLSLQLRFSIYY